MALATYDVHASGPGHDSAASVSVSIRPRADEDGPLYPGRAVSENVLRASVGAYVDAINALLVDTGVDVASAVPSPGETNTHETDPDHHPRQGPDHVVQPLSPYRIPPAFARGARNREAALGGLSTAGRLRRGASLDRNGARTRSAMAEVRN